jgi:hypothetical protein
MDQHIDNFLAELCWELKNLFGSKMRVYIDTKEFEKILINYENKETASFIQVNVLGYTPTTIRGPKDCMPSLYLIFVKDNGESKKRSLKETFVPIMITNAVLLSQYILWQTERMKILSDEIDENAEALFSGVGSIANAGKKSKR